MILKARENMEAAKYLAEMGLPNAAASRAYYCAYHACWSILDASGLKPDKVRNGNPWWSHEHVAENVCTHGPREFTQDLRDEYKHFLLEERQIADYFEEDVESKDLEKCLELAEKILGIAGGQDDA